MIAAPTIPNDVPTKKLRRDLGMLPMKLNLSWFKSLLPLICQPEKQLDRTSDNCYGHASTAGTTASYDGPQNDKLLVSRQIARTLYKVCVDD